MSENFYLTGGTALSRFYCPVRFSDDLDFFHNELSYFRADFKQVTMALVNSGLRTFLHTDTLDFRRIIITDETGLELKTDWVRDRTPHVTDPTMVGIYRIDSIDEITGNKLCAIMDRDVAKDMVDLLSISIHYPDLNWQMALNTAWEKQLFELTDLIIRLETFPISWLDKIEYQSEVTYQQQKSAAPEQVKALINKLTGRNIYE
jgi:predicted nucleotidyltransferase component of viral defense system